MPWGPESKQIWTEWVRSSRSDGVIESLSIFTGTFLSAPGPLAPGNISEGPNSCEASTPDGPVLSVHTKNASQKLQNRCCVKILEIYLIVYILGLILQWKSFWSGADRHYGVARVANPTVSPSKIHWNCSVPKAGIGKSICSDHWNKHNREVRKW